MKKSIGQILIRLREEKGLSQYDAAKQLGIKRARYNSWENGIARPRVDMLNKLAEFYGVNPDYLLGFDAVVEAPSWASAKDRRDIKKFIEQPEVLYYDGIEFSEEDRQKMIGVMETIAWEAKRQNKEAYKKARENMDDGN
ncbi:helix-turn-helix domain-containing protein [Paenibacillus beijingensis]|uniref:XRE family transcriptional regulator n=1 Tax=Paenibacillus beijingensis TaxID=1126833 RepID=A0A0D5NF80_9BACL|nr:helix-turn-helix transcriptional regulator [Paenibacillus beijingensis]AJY73906.1 XRE family transcriptional regulator [Paenibacillus beijingensis]